MADEVQRRMLELIFQRDFSPIYAIAPLLRTMRINFVGRGLAPFAWHEFPSFRLPYYGHDDNFTMLE